MNIKQEPQEMEVEEGAVGGAIGDQRKPRRILPELIVIDDEEYSYSEIRYAEKKEFIRKARKLGYHGDLTTGDAKSKLVKAVTTGQLGPVPDPISAGILEQMEQQVCSIVRDSLSLESNS